MIRPLLQAERQHAISRKRQKEEAVMNMIRRRLGALILAAALLTGLIPAALAAGAGPAEELTAAGEETLAPEENVTVPDGEEAAAEAEAPSDTMLTNFVRSRTCEPGRFADVAEDSWYAPNVATAYELNLSSGTGADTFDPGANMTVAMAVALAARLHAIYHTGSADALVQGDPWYQVYVDYALANGLMTEGQFEDLNADATRAQCAVLLSRAVPAGELAAVNTVEDGAIPDVPADSAYYEDIYTLYRAGILTGNDAAGTFTPDAAIDRVSMITIATRIADRALRQGVTLEYKLNGIAVKSSLWLFPEDTWQLTAAPVPAAFALPELTWTSADPAIATVDETGLVTMVSAGTTTVTVSTADGLSASCKVHVMARAVTEVTLDRTEISLYGGETARLTAALAPENATNRTPIWSSSDPAVATVDETGLVTAVGTGTAVITARSYSGPLAQCTVSVSRVFTQVNGVTYIDGVVIVNKSYPVPKNYAPGLLPEVSAAYQAMKAGAAADGINIWFRTHYRSYWTQKSIYESYVARDGRSAADRYSARPGYSEHQAGVAMDLNSLDFSFGETAAGKWIANHCAEYGFILRYPKDKEAITGYMYEPWHVRYVGVELAQELYLGDGEFLTLEEYFGITSSYGG